jgi:PAS domain S-box-containing protein
MGTAKDILTMHLTDSTFSNRPIPLEQLNLQLADLVIEFDQNGRIWHSSQPITSQENEKIFDILDHLEIEVLKEKMNLTLKTDSPVTVEMGIHWSSEFKWFSGSLILFNPELKHYLLVLRDSSKSLYNKLALNNLLDSSHEGYIFLKAKNPSQPFWFEKSESFWNNPFFDQTISDLNTAFLEMWGWTREEAFDRNLGVLLADDNWLSTQMWQKLLKKGTLEGECTVDHPKSTRILRYEFHSMYDQLGRFIGHFGVWHDVTKQRITERHHHLLATLVQSSQVAIFSLDLQYNIVTWNRGALLMYGYSEAEASHMSIWDLFAIEASSLKRIWEDKGRLQQVEAKHIKRNGELIDVSMNASIVMDSKNQSQTGWAIVCTDVTRQKQMEHELIEAKREAERANKAKSLFLANMSHELRTPLNAIIGYSELLLEESELLAPRTRLDITNIGKAGAHLLQMINHTLDLVKIESGKMDIDIEEISWDDLLEPLRASIMPLAQKNQNTILFEFEDPLPGFYSDCTRLRQILLNLLSNACKYTECGQVSLAIKTLENGIVFTVSDTGIGIPHDRLSRIFGEFEQAQKQDAKIYGGTGLGLSLSKNLAELLGGGISVESAVGQGSIFRMHLPNLLSQIGKNS